MDESLPADTDSRKNLGYAAIHKMYYELELDRFFNNKARRQDFQYNTNSIMTLLVISRILSLLQEKSLRKKRSLLRAL